MAPPLSQGSWGLALGAPRAGLAWGVLGGTAPSEGQRVERQGSALAAEPGVRVPRFHLARGAVRAPLHSPAVPQPQQKAPPLPTLGFCAFKFC